MATLYCCKLLLCQIHITRDHSSRDPRRTKPYIRTYVLHPILRSDQYQVQFILPKIRTNLDAKLIQSHCVIHRFLVGLCKAKSPPPRAWHAVCTVSQGKGEAEERGENGANWMPYT